MMFGPRGMLYDVIIVGAGPAGLTAGIFARAREMSTLILEARQAGGQLAVLYPTKSVYDYPGYIAIEAEELGRIFVEHARLSGCELHEGEEVTELKRKGEHWRVGTTKGYYEGRSVVLAMGIGLFESKRLAVPGEDAFEGNGVSYGVRDRREYKGKRILIVGGGDSALEAALQIVVHAAEVYLIHRREQFRAMEKSVDAIARSHIKILMNSEVAQISGDKEVRHVVVYNNQTLEKRTIDVDAIIVQVGFETKSGWLKKWGLEMEGERLIKVKVDMSTSLPGVFACGDIVFYTSKEKRIVTGCGEAVTAIASAYKFVKSPYWA
jgi:thioredoxin reductase